MIKTGSKFYESYFMRKYLILILIVHYFYLSCSFVTRTTYGAKKMKVQNEYSIKSLVQKYNLDTTNICSLKPSNYLEYFVEYFETPILFNNNGKFVSSGNCYKTFDDLLANLTYTDKFKIAGINRNEDNPTFGAIFNPLVNVQGQPINSNQLQANCDFILVLPFALALGNKIQVTDLKNYCKAAKTNKNVVIKIVFVNLDKQEWWGDEWNRKIKIDI